MRIDYEISEGDFMKAQRLGIKQSRSVFNRWAFSVVPVFGLVLLICIAFSVVQHGFSANLLPGLIVPLGTLSFPFLITLKIRRLYVSSRNLHGPLSLDATDEGMHFQGPTFSSQVSWSYYSRFCEDENSFLIFQNQRLFNLIPKRHLSSEQIVELRGLFTSHISGQR